MTRALALAALLGLAACGKESAPDATPVPEKFSPSQGSNQREVSLTIEGRDLRPRVVTAFGGAQQSRVDRGYQVRLGRISLEGAALNSEGVIAATVPKGLLPGDYAITVIDPWGRSTVLDGAYRVTKEAEGEDRVASFTVEAANVQTVAAPFDVTVTARDVQGVAVEAFNGTVALSDTTGSALPRTLGHFKLGVWVGKVEVLTAHPATVLTVTDERGRTGRSAPIAVSATSPGALVFATPERSVAAGSCSEAIDVELVTAGGRPAPAATPTEVLLRAPQSLDLETFSDASCTTKTDRQQLLAGESRARFFARARKATDVRLYATVTGMNPATQWLRVRPGAPTAIEYLTAAHTVNAGNCSPALTVRVRDSNGNSAPFAQASPLGLSSAPATGLSLFLDAACTQSATSILVAAGAATATFYFRATAAQPYTLTASATGLSSASQTQTVVPAGSAARLTITTPSRTAVAGSCSAVLTVRAEDSLGNPVTNSSPTTLDASASPATTTAVYSDPACGTQVTTVSIAPGSSTADFYFRGTGAGAANVTLTLPSVTSVSQAQQIIPAAPAQLTFLTTPITAAAGACSAPVQLRLDDAFGNATTAAAQMTLGLGANPSTGFQFFEASDSACTTPVTTLTVAQGAGTIGLRFRGTAAGAVTITLTHSSLATATQTEQIVAAAPAALEFLSAPVTVIAGSCSAALTFGLEDAFGNPARHPSDLTVALTAAPSTGVTFYSDASCLTQVSAAVLAANAASGTFHFKAQKAVATSITLSATGFASAAQTETVTPAAPAKLVFVTAAQTVKAGDCSAALTVELQDAFSNPSPAAADQTFGVTGSPSAGTGFSTTSNCASTVTAVTVASTATTASFHLRATAAGPLTVQLTSASFPTISQAQTVTAADPSVFAWDAIGSPQTYNAPFTVTVRARDAFGNAASSFTGTAALTVGPTAGEVDCIGACSGAQQTAAFTAGAWAGTVRVGWPVGTRQLTATSGAVTGSSNSFTVIGPAARSRPVARISATPPLAAASAAVAFDASGSSDYQTPRAALEVSWDWTGTDTAAPGTGGWTVWTTVKTASRTFTAGTHRPRLAVRDADGDIGFATVTIRAVDAATTVCTVNTASIADDAATGCGTGAAGPDGVLSLPEAVRLSNALAGTQVVTFSGALQIVGPVTLLFSADAEVIAPAGVVLDAVVVDVTGGALSLNGLSLRNGSTAMTVRSGASATVRDCTFTGTPGLSVSGGLVVDRAQMTGCTAACIRTDAPLSQAISVSHSRFSASPGQSAISLGSCLLGGVLDVMGSEFSGLSTAIFTACATETRIRGNTFDGNTTAVGYAGGGLSHTLVNNIITQHSSASGAVSCGGALFSRRSHQLVFGNASNGCVDGDSNGLAVDPLYVFRSGGDLRLQRTSPAIDNGFETGLDMNGTGPGNSYGAGPDRGGHESW